MEETASINIDTKGVEIRRNKMRKDDVSRLNNASLP